MGFKQGRGGGRHVMLPVWAFCSSEILRLPSSRLFKTLFTLQAMRTDIISALTRKFLKGDMTITAAWQPSSAQCSAEKKNEQENPYTITIQHTPLPHNTTLHTKTCENSDSNLQKKKILKTTKCTYRSKASSNDSSYFFIIYAMTTVALRDTPK